MRRRLGAGGSSSLRTDLLFQAIEVDTLVYRTVLTGESSGFRPYPVDPRLLALSRFRAQPLTRPLKPATVDQVVAILHALYEFPQQSDENGLQMRMNPLWRMKRAIRALIVATKRVLGAAALEATLETADAEVVIEPAVVDAESVAAAQDAAPRLIEVEGNVAECWVGSASFLF